MQDEKAKKRANSNLMYYLKYHGNKEAYDASPQQVRKDFFVAWFADKLKNGETTSSGSKDIGTSKEDGREYKWVSKHFLVKAFGKEKAEARIASGKMLNRADPLTGLSDEWNIEYKSFLDVGSEMEKEAQNHRIHTEMKVESEAAKTQLMEDWFDARLQNDGEAGSSSPPVYIKQEPTEAESKDEKQKTEAQNKLNKTIETLTTNPRHILKIIGETVTTLKCMFQSTMGNRYTEKINEDIGKLLPKFKSDFKTVESFVTKSTHDMDKFAGTDEGEVVIRAVATKLEGNYEKYNELCEWHSKFNPNNSKKQRKQ